MREKIIRKGESMCVHKEKWQGNKRGRMRSKIERKEVIESGGDTKVMDIPFWYIDNIFKDGNMTEKSKKGSAQSKDQHWK